MTSVTACGVLVETGERFGGGAVERAHARDGRGLVVVRTPREQDARADGLGEHEGVARAGARLGPDPVGVHQALHREAEDRLLGADGVTPRHDTPRLGHDRGRGREDGPTTSTGGARERPRC